MSVKDSATLHISSCMVCLPPSVTGKSAHHRFLHPAKGCNAPSNLFSPPLVGAREGCLCYVSTQEVCNAGEHLVSCCEGGVIAAWNPATGALMHTLKEHTADVEAVEWCPQASLPLHQHVLATASQDHSVR